MEYANLSEENYSDAACFALGDLGARFPKQTFDVAPLHIGTRRVGEEEFERA